MLRILLCSFFLLVVHQLSARPMGIAFNEMITKCKTIVIAEFLGPEFPDAEIQMRFKLKVTKTLHGSVTSDTILVGRAHGRPYVREGVECIAFINQSGDFEWVGNSVGNKPLEQSVIFMEGFYDFNAYLVSPSTITYSQLISYLKTKSYSGKVVGQLHFLNPETAKMEPGTISFNIDYTYTDGKIEQKVTSKGMEIVDFEQPNLWLSSWESEIVLEYESNLVRPLNIIGDIQQLNDDGTFSVVFWLEAPEELTELEFHRYLAQPAYGHPYWEIDVITEYDGKSYLLVLGKEIGRIGKLHGFKGRTYGCKGLSPMGAENTGHLKFEYDEDVVIELPARPTDRELMDYSHEDFIRQLRLKPAEGIIYVKKNGKKKELGTCKLVFKRTLFTDNPNFKD